MKLKAFQTVINVQHYWLFSDLSLYCKINKICKKKRAMEAKLYDLGI